MGDFKEILAVIGFATLVVLFVSGFILVIKRIVS